MIELDDRLLVLQREVRAWAREARRYGPELDRDPDAVYRHLDLSVVSRLGALQIPARYAQRPLELTGERFYLTDPLELVVALEECAWGDLGVALAAPGAPMAGVAVEVLGDDAQKEFFFGRLQEGPTWTFFALTEPERGSDAGGLRTTLTPAPGGGFILSGAKRYVGNAVRGQLGVVFARTGPGPLGLGAVVVDTSAPGFKAEPIPTLGLRGAQLGAITMDAVPIPPEQVLGRGLRATQRGMWGWLRTFNLLRPSVASMGVGMARAAYEYVLSNRTSLNGGERDRLAAMERRIAAVRALTRRAAIEVRRYPDAGALASAAKVRAARLAEDVVLSALDFFGPAARYEHPFLEKLARDVRGIELMEGAGNIQRLSLFNLLLRGRLPTAAPDALSRIDETVPDGVDDGGGAVGRT